MTDGLGGATPGHPAPAVASELERLSFEELVAALEGLTDRLASGQIGIEEAADLYERAERLHAAASERLARVQARIEALGSSGGTREP